MVARLLFYQVKCVKFLKSTIATVVVCTTVALFAVPMAPQTRVVRYQSVSGKISGPALISVSYALEHPLNEPLEISIYGWVSSRDVSSLTIKARLLSDHVKWAAGDKERTFEGPIKKNDSRNFRFSVIPVKKGDSYIAIDISYPEKNIRQSRTEVVLIKGGGKIEKKHLNGGKVKAAHIEMY